MPWLSLVSYAFGALFLINAAPHLVSGVMGRPFQSPFAKPPGKGLSSAMVNVLWGFVNLVVAYFLIEKVGVFDLHALPDAAAFGFGILAGSVMLAKNFAPLHGGSIPR